MRIRRLDPDADAAVVHDWVTRPYARFWDMQDADVTDVRRAYAEIDASDHHRAFIGEDDGRPAFLCETYDPVHTELADHYDVRPSDLGMHFLVAPPTGEPVHGHTLRVLRAVMDLCFRDSQVRRVVVEPDARNSKVHALNAAVGFQIVREVELSDKRALLSFCTRDRYRLSLIDARESA